VTQHEATPAAHAQKPAPGARSTLDLVLRRLVWAVVLGVLVLAGFGLYADLGQLAMNLAALDWIYFPAALALVMLSYVVRLWRWGFYLRLVEVPVPPRESALVFFAGFVMSVTPGKFGEVLKALLLRESVNAPMTKTAPIVVAERLTDFIALVLLSTVGIVTFSYGSVLIAVAATLSLTAVVLISSRPLAHSCIQLTRRIPGIRRLSDKFLAMYDSMADLVRLGPLLAGTLLAAAAWFIECLGVWLVCVALGADAAQVTLPMVIFIHAFATIFGAVSMMPGGLGVTEGSMSVLLVKIGKMTSAPAVAATLLVRLCTLWFGVAVGLVALAAWRREQARRARADSAS
jgi:uncharacterized protein (TIRG00374 family)